MPPDRVPAYIDTGRGQSYPGFRRDRSRFRSFRFFLGVAVVYDTDSEDLLRFRKVKRSEAYGWFTGFATCGACKTVARVVDYETA